MFEPSYRHRLAGLMLQSSAFPAQSSLRPPRTRRRAQSAPTSHEQEEELVERSASTRSRRAKKGHAPRKKSTASRTIKLHKSFVASSELRPMARQLIEYRTPAAYAGVEAYANKHAGTEPGALAWFAIGYAHYLDAQYPAAITAFQKAQPNIGELKDYTSYYIGNAYVLNNNPEASLTYLRDFGTTFPDSVYTNDATLAYAKALLATKRTAEAVQVLTHHSGGGVEGQYLLGKAYVQNGQGARGSTGPAAGVLQLSDESTGGTRGS